jgi:hypothetical protein
MAKQDIITYYKHGLGKASAKDGVSTMKIYIQRMITLKIASSASVQAFLPRLPVGAAGLELQDMCSVLGIALNGTFSEKKFPIIDGKM